MNIIDEFYLKQVNATLRAENNRLKGDADLLRKQNRDFVETGLVTLQDAVVSQGNLIKIKDQEIADLKQELKHQEGNHKELVKRNRELIEENKVLQAKSSYECFKSDLAHQAKLLFDLRHEKASLERQLDVMTRDLDAYKASDRIKTENIEILKNDCAKLNDELNEMVRRKLYGF